MNKEMTEERAVKHFFDLLDLIEFRLQWNTTTKTATLIDLQGANLGDIQSEKHATYASMLDRLSTYIDDYINESLFEIFPLLEEDTWQNMANSLENYVIENDEQRESQQGYIEQFRAFEYLGENDTKVSVNDITEYQGHFETFADCDNMAQHMLKQYFHTMEEAKEFIKGNDLM